METLTYKVDFVNRQIVFNRKPGEQVRAVLKTAGMRWSPQGYWYCPRGSYLPDALEKYVDKENGYRRPDGPCWICKDPAGFFRARGAATPVWCDKCAAERP